MAHFLSHKSRHLMHQIKIIGVTISQIKSCTCSFFFTICVIYQHQINMFLSILNPLIRCRTCQKVLNGKKGAQFDFSKTCLMLIAIKVISVMDLMEYMIKFYMNHAEDAHTIYGPNNDEY